MLILRRTYLNHLSIGSEPERLLGQAEVAVVLERELEREREQEQLREEGCGVPASQEAVPLMRRWIYWATGGFVLNNKPSTSPPAH